MAQQAFNFLGVSKGKLQAIESLLDPNVWKAMAADSYAMKKLYKQTVAAIRECSLQAGYLWDSQIAACKLSSSTISAMSVGGGADAGADAIASGDVVGAAAVAETVPVVDAVSAQGAAASEPVAAAMAALAATPGNPENAITDPAALVVDADTP